MYKDVNFSKDKNQKSKLIYWKSFASGYQWETLEKSRFRWDVWQSVGVHSQTLSSTEGSHSLWQFRVCYD